jgi:hypothetical protein
MLLGWRGELRGREMKKNENYSEKRRKPVT